MPPTLTRSAAAQTARSERGAVARWLLAGVVVVALTIGAGEVLEPPGTVAMTLRNESSMAVSVQARSAEDAPSVMVATVDPGEDRAVQEVLDLGDRWLVSFRVAGVDVGDDELSREELVANGFEIVIPGSVDSAAGAEGIEPAP